ncbi:MAG TPA: PspA/IM30 family protein, partial [Actinomycetota bacterium]|nr:PspA/IM30 family protein [Actinomycetota bacterium]
QAIQEAKNRHEMLSQQAAAVLGNQRELELKLGRSIEEVERLQASARQALVLSDKAKSSGDQEKTKSYDDAANAFAMKLVAAEASMGDLKKLHDRALDAAEMARRAVEQNAFGLQKQLAERSKLLSQIEQTKMQERMNDALRSMGELAPKGNTPTLVEVRDKIESRYAKALGQAEIASGSIEAKMLEVEKASIDAQGAERLESIRATLALDKGSE